MILFIGHSIERRRTAAKWFGCQGPCVSCLWFRWMIKHARTRQSAPVDIGQGHLKNDSVLYSAQPTIKSELQDAQLAPFHLDLQQIDDTMK